MGIQQPLENLRFLFPGREMGSQCGGNTWRLRADGHVPGWADEYTGARWQPTGVDVDMSDGSSIDLNGDVYLAVRGAAMKTDPYYKSAGMDDYDIAVINANKGNVTIVTPSSTGESFVPLPVTAALSM
ncbi:MAG: hypothetical protein ACLUIQ_03270 [Dialister invisus]